MTKEELQKIFQSKYDRNNYIKILEDIFSVSTILNNPITLEGKDENEIKGVELVDEYKPDNHLIGFYEYDLNNTKIKIELNRVGLRNYVHGLLKYNVDAAIVVFHKDNIWRLTFACDLKGEETDAKRFSFVFGDNDETYRTACDRFLDLQEKGVTYKSINDAFSVEALSDDFFYRYKEVYTDFCNYMVDNQKDFKDFFIIDSTGKAVRDYVKKMMGRLTFLYFLQKKGWLNNRKDYLQNLFKNSKYQDDYLDKVLEPLFFGVLNTKEENRRKLFEDKGYDLSLLKEWKNIPYLNGGLFEQDELDKPDSKFPKEYFERLFDFFAQYNFTIDENDPNDAEVGVNPEMLGRIFENLLEDNKDKGAFYTPQKIVEYMCKESLIQYLKTKIPNISIHNSITTLIKNHKLEKDIQKKDILTDINNALKNVKICDPAIGSGAFPMGLLNEIFYIRTLIMPFIDKEENINSVELKKQIIQNNIYGVDIEKGAVDIARLRFWLSLIVDEDTPKTLPNLDYKIVQGNSLLERFEDIDLDFSKINLNSNEKKLQKNLFNEVENTQLTIEFKKQSINELNNLIKEYFEENDHEIKEDNKNRIEEIINEAIKECFNRTKKDYKKRINNLTPLSVKTKKIEKEIENLNNKLNELDSKLLKLENIKKDNKPYFLWNLYFKDVFDNGGFDIVIGNPPYISTKGVSEEDKKLLEESYGFADDTYNHFVFKASSLLNTSGILSFIIPKTFWTTQTKKNLRDLILSKSINYIIDTANPFPNVMVDTCILSFSNKIPNENNKVLFLDSSKDFKNPIKYNIKQSLYKETLNNVFFKPTEENIKIYNLYGKKVKALYNKWWDKICTSKKIEQNKEELKAYRESLKPGDIALLGCLTEGGQGLATGNNGKYIAVRKSTKWAKNIVESRPKKLAEAIKAKAITIPEMKNFTNTTEFLASLSEKQIIDLFDSLKDKYGRDIFGQGYLFRLIDDEDIANVDELTQEEKENGIDTSKKYYVPYDKGDKDGNRWYLETPFAIAWSKENVRFLKTNSGKKGKGMPVVRNPQFYFREGFCWTDINSTFLKSRIKENGVFDVVTMTLFTQTTIPDYYYVCLINTDFMSYYVDNFLNNTSHFQINDCRQLPIIIPSKENLNKFECLFNNAYKIKIGDELIQKLEEIEKTINKEVKTLYNII